MNRREFLINSMKALSAFAVMPSLSFPQNSDALYFREEPPPEPAKNVQPIQTYIAGDVTLLSGIRNEKGRWYYRNSEGAYDPSQLELLNWFLRCRDGKWTTMDAGIIERLNYLSALLGGRPITVTSGYRSPEYNKKLAKNNENVAKNSLHMQGKAVDICVHGLSIRTVCSYANLVQQVFGGGGLGYYPKQNFVHIDTGPQRQWIR
jgi:uncharacterized protein YcbK (DUF882 family)